MVRRKCGPETVLFTPSPIFSLLPLLLLSYAGWGVGTDNSFDSGNNSQDNEEPTSLTMLPHCVRGKTNIAQVLKQPRLIYLPLSRKEPIHTGEFSKIIGAHHLFQGPTLKKKKKKKRFNHFWGNSFLNGFHKLLLLKENTVIIIQAIPDDLECSSGYSSGL